jgi:hypothetical protein
MNEMTESKNKQARRWARVGKTARKTYRRLKTGSYSGQHKEFPKEMELTVTVTDGDKPTPLCEQRKHTMRLTHTTTHRWTDTTVRVKAHYINVFEEEYEVENTDKDGNTTTVTKTRKVDGDYTHTTYNTETKQTKEE